MKNHSIVSRQSIEELVRQDKFLVLAALVAVTTVAWLDMAHEARAMVKTGVCQCLGMKMFGPDTEAWTAAELFPLFLMWSEMMIAMMLPSAAPMILMFAAVNRKRREQERPFVPSAIFVSGYIAAWTAFSAFAAITQWILHSTALLSPKMAGTSPILGGVVLITAGVFQWTPLKNACLAHCRSPLNFLMTDWSDGRFGAFWMGLKHGAFCTGCCWFLMLLLFVVGVMNLWWIALISALVLIEKAAPRGRVMGKIAGASLVLWGTWMLAHSV